MYLNDRNKNIFGKDVLQKMEVKYGEFLICVFSKMKENMKFMK